MSEFHSPCRRENNLLVAAKPSRRMLDSVSAILYAMKDDLPIILKLGRGKVEHCVGVSILSLPPRE